MVNLMPPLAPRRTLRPGVILALVCGAQFLVVLDVAIVNVALPSVQADLGLAQSDLQWVVITYGLMLGGLLMVALIVRRRSSACLRMGVGPTPCRPQGGGAGSTVSGLAGGMVETAKEIGGALGTAIVASVAIAHVGDLLADGVPAPTALTEGFQRGSLVAAGFNVVSVLAALTVLRRADGARRVHRRVARRYSVTPGSPSASLPA